MVCEETEVGASFSYNIRQYGEGEAHGGGPMSRDLGRKVMCLSSKSGGQKNFGAK